MNGTGRQVNASVALGWLAPIATLAIAYGLWWISDRLVQVGPFDRPAFGWTFVIPIWLAAPVVAGIVWRGLPVRHERTAVLIVGAIVGLAAALLFWQSATGPGCETAPTRTGTDWIPPSLLAGAITAGGLLLGGIIAASLFRSRQRLAAIVAGVLVDGLILAVGLVVMAVILSGPGCERSVPVGG